MRKNHIVDSKKLSTGTQSGTTNEWDSHAILKGSLDNVPGAPTNVVKIYILSTKLGKIFTTRKRSLGRGNIFTPVCHSVHRGGMRGWSQGGHAWLLLGGAMCGCSWGACVVAPGGHVWLLEGDCVVAWGHVWLLRGACVAAPGGPVWLLLGAVCMVAPRGHAWLLLGGMHGFS